ncbi:MAG: choice-of-anchor X domain-containing protein, partial [Pseudomonadota bacterium]
ANHDGVHLEEQSLQAGQLAKLFMVVGGLATDETIILDPDFPVASGAGDSQTILATQSEHSLTFAAFWNEQNSEKVALQLFGPNRRCRIPMQKHDGFDMRLGPTYALARIELPYRCTAGQVDAILHEGDWTLRFQNRGATSDTVKVMVLADSGVTLRTDSKVGTGKALLMARLIEGDELLRKGVRIFANMRPNRPSSGDSEKQDGVTGNDRPNVTVTVPGRGLGSVVGPDTPVIIAPPARGGIVAGETREKENMITFDASQRLNPALLEALQQRAEIMGLRPEVLEQLRGRFVMPMEPTGIELRDDGTNGDEGINDGIFSAIVSLPNPGLYQIRTVATQARPEGIMTREALSSVLTK